MSCESRDTCTLAHYVLFMCNVIPYSATSLTVAGMELHRGAVVCVKPPCDDAFPEFSEVKYVLVPDGHKSLLVKKLYTSTYSNHFSAYIVEATLNWSIVSVADLALHQVFYRYQLGDVSYIPVKSCHHVELCV